MAERTRRWRAGTRRFVLPRGLRWRLTAWVALVLLASTAVTFVAIYRGTGSQLRRQTDRELAGDATAFGRRLEQVAAGAGAGRISAAANAYIHSQAFRTTSQLLYVVVPGKPPVTNVPELFGLPSSDGGEEIADQQDENRLAGRLLAARPGYSTQRLPDVGGLRLLIRRIDSGGQAVAKLGVGEPLGAIHSAQEGIARTFLLVGALTLLAAILAAYLIADRVSRPLRRMARVAAQVDAGDLAPRIDTGAARDEVRVLADAFNHMLDRLEDAFARQQSFVSDASHELRTPLTVIRGQLEVLALNEQPAPEEVRRVEAVVQAEVARMAKLVDALLLLSRTDESEFVHLEDVDVERYVRDLWEGMRQIADRHFELSLAASGTLRADPDRLAQALRNLVRNAIEHTEPRTGRVRLSVVPLAPDRLRFTVEDDGPGIPAGQRDRIFDRFHRTDVARNRAAGGTGLGLAIVRAIAEAHGGTATAGASASHGGARLELHLPGFHSTEQTAETPRSPHTGGDDDDQATPGSEVAAASTPSPTAS